jgi:hypothetical protein
LLILPLGEIGLMQERRLFANRLAVCLPYSLKRLQLVLIPAKRNKETVDAFVDLTW